jgi:hypothetical protein
MASQVDVQSLPTELARANVFIHELSSLILPTHREVENVWDIANRVYDQHVAKIKLGLSD